MAMCLRRFLTRSRSICGLPTLTRLAGCQELQTIFKATTLAEFREYIEGVFHATIHMSLGGVDDCKYRLDEGIDQFGEHTKKLFGGMGLLANTVWRTAELGSLLRCPMHCSSDTSFEECACRSATPAFLATSPCVPLSRPSYLPLGIYHWGRTASRCLAISGRTPLPLTRTLLPSLFVRSCPIVDEIWGTDISFEQAYSKLATLGVDTMLESESATSQFFESVTPADSTDSIVRLKNATTEQNREFWKWALDFVCHPGKMGQYATPLAANNDPIFWVSHAAWGRYWAMARLAPAFKENMDWTWETLSGDMDDCENSYEWHDLLPFTSFSNKDKSDVQLLSNQELFQFFAPDNDALPYVYSSFTWAHCEGHSYESFTSR